METSSNGGIVKKFLIWAMLAITTMLTSGFTTLPAYAAYTPRVQQVNPFVLDEQPYFYMSPRTSGSLEGNISVEAVTIVGTPTPTKSYRWFECLYIHGDPTQANDGSDTVPSDCALIPGQVDRILPFGAFNPQRHIIAEVTISNRVGSAVMYSAAERSMSVPKEYLDLGISGGPYVSSGISVNVTWDGRQDGKTIRYQWYRCTSPQSVSLTLGSDCRLYWRTPSGDADKTIYLYGQELYGPNSNYSDVGFYFLARVSVSRTDLPPIFTATVGPMRELTNPSLPRNLVYERVKATSAELSWDAPEDTGGREVTDYSIQISRNGTTWSDVPKSSVDRTTKFELLGLDPWTEYHVRVAARNQIGAGETTQVSFTTLGPAPSEPINLRISTVASTSLTLTWDIPALNGVSDITSYNLYQIDMSGDRSSWTMLEREASNALTFEVTGLEKNHSYAFRVTAVSEVSEGPPSDFIVVKTLSTIASPPTNLTATPESIGINSASLTWTAPTDSGGLEVTNYRIDTSLDGSNWTNLKQVSSEETTVDVTGLAPGTTYFVRVTALNIRGVGETAQVSLTTLATTPTAPLGLTASRVTSTSLTLSWAAPASDGGAAVTSYQAELSSNNGSSWTALSTSTQLSTSIDLLGLAAATSYQFRVSAINSEGASEISQISFTTLATVPAAPRTLAAGSITSSSLTLSWLLPASNGGAAITDYKVEFSGNAGLSWTEITHTPSNNLAFNVTSLRSNQAYRFRVSAVNEGGVGAASNIVSVTTLVGPPQEPINLAASRATATGVSLAWVAPANTGGVRITDYQIQLSRDGGNTWTTVTKQASTSTSLALTGLASGTTYQVRVAAVNARGAGATTTSSFTTLAGPPSAPTNLRSSNITGTTATIAWDLPASNGGSAITNYRVEVSSNCSTYTVLPRTASNSLAQNVTNLQPGLRYCFRVSTITAAGTSPASTVLNLTTVGNSPNAPTSLRVTAAATQVTLSWVAATVTGGGPIRNYLVEYSTNGGSSWISVTKAVSTSTSLSIRNLTRSTAYLFRVYAVNDSGTSAASANLTVTTPAR